jgi:feruloyl esterase
MEAQRYPADYDGIIAGAPANHWTHLFTEAVWDTQALLSDPASYIPASKLPAIEAATLAACDVRDGVKDGVIDDPSRCHFDPSPLLCKGAESASCLTAAQLATLKKLYSGPVDSKGAPVFFGHAVGGETGRGGWEAWVTGAEPEKSLSYAFGTQFYKNMVFENAQWDFHAFQVNRDMKVADDRLARTLNATDPDLKRFEQRGGKLILYHGWSDAAIPPFSAIDYYQSVVKKMGSGEANRFVRLYMAPGMQHCGGGPGLTSFGQGFEPPRVSPGMAAALEQWVEQGSAPDRIVAAKVQDGAVVRTRPLCPYPQVAKWNGSGSTDDAANFSCVAPN